MRRGITVDLLTDEIMKGLQEYKSVAMDDVVTAAKKAANATKKEIEANAPRNKGNYAKSWKVTKIVHNSCEIRFVVHSKDHYRLTHLLEKGHATRNGGRTKAQPHIAPAEEHGNQMFLDDVKKMLSK